MAVDCKIEKFEDWYKSYELDREGALRQTALTKHAENLVSCFSNFKTEHDKRVANYDKLAMLADAEVITKRDDLPNVSSGEVSGMILRMARNLVQHTPNVNVRSKFDDDSAIGAFISYILKARIIGDELYSNDMQQNLFASTKNSLTFGYDCVIPILQQDARGVWSMQYDNIYYHDVFPEPGVRDIRRSSSVFVRRYLTKGDIARLIRHETPGWDIPALKYIFEQRTPTRQRESVDHQSKKHRTIPEGFEMITWYSDSGENFLTFEASTKALVRIEKNKHPLKEHPVFFLVLEKDLNQPLGKSQVERVLGRQEFQDLLLNGAMKAWTKELNPPLIGYGTTNAVLNMSPGKFNSIPNPNARVEAFSSSTQTLLQFAQISQTNAANMVSQTGAADQQMASQSTGGMMSQTPQGVEAQQAMVDITTNNYQKSIENFFSRYCSYALTLYFHELKSAKSVTPPAEVRQQMVKNGFDETKVNDETGEIELEFADLAVPYNVQTVPGSLIELEDDKQLRILNELFIPLSQSMNALAQAGDQETLLKATAAMQFIIQKQLELSGSMHATELRNLMQYGMTEEVQREQLNLQALEDSINGATTMTQEALSKMEQIQSTQAEQISLLTEGQGAIMERLGVPNEASAE